MVSSGCTLKKKNNYEAKMRKVISEILIYLTFLMILILLSTFDKDPNAHQYLSRLKSLFGIKRQIRSNQFSQ